MIFVWMRRFTTLASLTCLAACVAPNIVPLTSSESQFGSSEDENKLLEQSRQLHDEFDGKGLLLEDTDMKAYIERVARPLVPKGADGVVNFNFHILRFPAVNAFAVPSGDIYFTVGLLALLNSEAELAQVAGHEIAHVVLRHGLKSYQVRRTGFVAAQIADIFLLGTSIAYMPFLSSVASFSREQEEEADMAGLHSIINAGYDPSAAVKIFTTIQEIKKGEEIQNSAYSTHPSNKRRMETLVSAIHVQSASDETRRIGLQEYIAFRTRIMAENIQLKLNARQYEMARDAADVARLLEAGSPWPYYYRGEAYRLMGDDPKGAAHEYAWLYSKNDDDALVESFSKRRNEFYAEAENAYKQALASDHDFILAERGMGLVYLQLGKNQFARERLVKYLSSDTNIRDHQYITNLIKGIEP